MNALQRKAILDALKQYGIETWAGLEKDAAEANLSVEAYLAALGVAVPAVAPAPAPAVKPAAKKIVAPAPVAVDNTARIAELIGKITEMTNAIKILGALGKDTKAFEAELVTMRAELAALTGKPAKKAEKTKVELAQAKPGDVLGEVPCTGVFYFSDLRDPYAMLKFVHLGKVDSKHENAAQGDYFDVRYRIFAHAALKGDWKIFLLRGFATDDDLADSAVFSARSWQASEKGAACVSMYQYVGGDDLPAEGDALELVWDYEAHRFVVGAGKKAYKVERTSKNGAAQGRDGVELPVYGATNRDGVQLPKVAPRGTK